MAGGEDWEGRLEKTRHEYEVAWEKEDAAWVRFWGLIQNEGVPTLYLSNAMWEYLQAGDKRIKLGWGLARLERGEAWGGLPEVGREEKIDIMRVKEQVGRSRARREKAIDDTEKRSRRRERGRRYYNENYRKMATDDKREGES